MDKGKPSGADLRRVSEEAAEGLHERLDDPEAPLEAGPIERGRVDAGPTGEREGGYRQAESGLQIVWIGGAALIIIVAILAIAFLR
ncbi:MAG TPA: hypothetical protein PKA74_10475 [Bauldia sp.]|nr:hypothetical protein [Bauldia sp.]